MNSNTGESGFSVWLADDDESIRFVLGRALEKAGYRVRTFESLQAAQQAIHAGLPDLLITDVRFPDGDGLDLIAAVKEHNGQIPVIVTTAYSDLEQAVSAFQRGAFDYLSKPVDLDDLLAIAEKAMAGRLSASQPSGLSKEEMVGESAAMQPVFRTIGRLSHSDISVLITGETGTGKELVARALHRHSPRKDGPFVAINTAAIPEDLLESELFGHEKGAFTGAVQRRSGRFEQARGGTLFLDEIGDMPLALQTRLLRVAAEGDYYRVGGRDLLQADTRIIAATHQNLAEKVKTGAFREDLYHRLNVINIHLPPLRQRKDDLARLVDHFLEQAALEMGLERKQLHPLALRELESKSWPGNVRQLRNVCRQLSVMAPGETIFIHDLPKELAETVAREDTIGDSHWREALGRLVRAQLANGAPLTLAGLSAELECVLIREALAHTGGNKLEAAKLLACSRNTLARKAKELDLDKIAHLSERKRG